MKDLKGWIDSHSEVFHSYFSELCPMAAHTLEARTDCRVIVRAYPHGSQISWERGLGTLWQCVRSWTTLIKVTGL